MDLEKQINECVSKERKQKINVEIGKAGIGVSRPKGETLTEFKTLDLVKKNRKY